MAYPRAGMGGGGGYFKLTVADTCSVVEKGSDGVRACAGCMVAAARGGARSGVFLWRTGTRCFDAIFRHDVQRVQPLSRGVD